MHKNILAGSLFLFSSLFVGHTWANSHNQVSASEIPYLQQPVSIDGVLNDTVWQQALQVPLNFEINPGENIPAAVKTIAYLFEDGENLYVAFNALDPEPSKIKAYLSSRDNLWTSDYVSVALDTFNDSRRAFQFYTNAIGVQADAIIDEITSNNDTGWDAIWQSAGALHEQGYAVEMKIPLDSLRFKNNQNKKQWNIRFSRVWIRDVEHEFSNVQDDRNNECKLCQFSSFVGFEKITPARNLTLIPAVTLIKNDQRDIENNQGWDNGKVVDRESLDLRWGVNQNMFVNATINPDFSQVETDEVQLEVNNRFAVFFPEKRAFFLDGADYFSNWSRLVHTRLFAEPDYGVKLTGKSGDHSYGLIALTDKDTTFLRPESQSSRIISLRGVKSDNQILRYRYDLGVNGNVGLTYTQRDALNYNNKMTSVDGKYWFNDSNFFKFQMMASDSLTPLDQLSDKVDNSGELLEQSGNAFSVNYTHSSRNWSSQLTHHRFGKDFRADSGFVSRSNWQASSASVERFWYPSHQQKWWKTITLDAQYTRVADLDGNRLNNRRQAGLAVEGVYQSELGITYIVDDQNYVAQRFSTEPERLLSQDYSIELISTFFAITPIAGLDFSGSLDWGDGIEFGTGFFGKELTINPSVEYQINDHWNFKLEYIKQTLTIDKEKAIDLKVFNMRTTYQVNVDNFFRLTLQSNDEGSENTLDTQWLYSYRVNPFTLFFLGYSDASFQDTRSRRFRNLKRTDRTFFMKFSYAFQL